MKVLDFHVHVGRRDHLTPRFISYYEKKIGPSLVELLDRLTPQDFLHYMDQESVSRAVLLAEYSPKATGTIPCEFVADFCCGTDRLIPFGAVDFDSSTDCGIQVERFVKDLGCRGLKLLPSYAHFFPNDAKMLPAYEAARDLGIPVMFHTGTSLFPGTRVRYADPLLLDDIADEFPDLSIIMSHGGRPFWYKEAEWMLGRHNNVHIDISGIPPHQLLTSFPKMDKFPDRFLFGSDWPNLPSVADQVRKILELPLKKTTVEGLLWGNGARMLGLD